MSRGDNVGGKSLAKMEMKAFITYDRTIGSTKQYNEY